MQAVARTTGVRASTRKVRLVADSIRNLPIDKAVALLKTTQKRGSSILLKTLQSAIANATQQGAVAADLRIVRIDVDGGPTLRRMHIGSRSHVRMYTKRSSHVRVTVGDTKDEKKVAKNEVKTVVKEEKKEEVK